MREARSGSQFTRGWESFAHWLIGLRRSLRRHVVASVVVAVAAGSVWFLWSLGEARSSVFDYLVEAYFGPFKSLSSMMGARAVRGAVYEQLRVSVFGGRTPSFLAQQWAWRVVICGLATFSLGAVAMFVHGQRAMQRRRIRGGRYRDMVAELKRQTLRRILVAIVVGGGIATCQQAALLGGRGVSALPDYVTSAAALGSGAIGRLVAADRGGRVGWYEAPFGPGLYEHRRVYDVLRRDVYGAPLVAISGRAAAHAAFFSMLLWAAMVWAAWWRKRRSDEIVLGGVRIPRQVEVHHFLICGTTGAGKTVAISEILHKVQGRGERAVVCDPSGDFVRHFYRKGHDVILNPLDARSVAWELWAEIRRRNEYKDFAESLFPPMSRDPFWYEAPRALFSAAAEELYKQGQASNRTLYELLTGANLDKLRGLLAHTTAATYLDKEAGATAVSLRSVVASKLESWSFLSDPPPGERPFSIRNFVEDDSDRWLFLSMREDQLSVLRPLVSLWCDVASRSLMSMPPDPERRLFLVLDELSRLQRLPALTHLASRGRKFGGVLVLGFQDVPQLRAEYGADLAQSIVGMPQTGLVLRSPEPNTARELSAYLGSEEVEVPTESISVGAASRDGASIQKVVRERALVMPSEIQTLPALHGYLRDSASMTVSWIRYGYRKFDDRAEPFVLRPDLAITPSTARPVTAAALSPEPILRPGDDDDDDGDDDGQEPTRYARHPPLTPAA